MIADWNAVYYKYNYNLPCVSVHMVGNNFLIRQSRELFLQKSAIINRINLVYKVLFR